MCADDDVRRPFGGLGDDRALLGGFVETRENPDTHAVTTCSVTEGGIMLHGKDRRRHQHRHLFPPKHSLERRPNGDLGLTEADVAADEAVHRVREFHVLLDLSGGARLVKGILVHEGRLEFPLPRLVGGEGKSGHPLAAGIELDEFAGDVFYAALRTRLEAVPIRASQTGQLREMPLAGGILLQSRDIVKVDVEDIVLLIEKLHHLLLHIAHPDALEPLESSDSVVLMDNVVSPAQLEKLTLIEAAHRRTLPSTPAFQPVEHLMFGEQRKADRWQEKALMDGSHRDLDPRAVRDLAFVCAVGSAEELFEAVLLGGGITYKEDTIALSKQAGDRRAHLGNACVERRLFARTEVDSVLAACNDPSSCRRICGMAADAASTGAGSSSSSRRGCSLRARSVSSASANTRTIPSGACARSEVRCAELASREESRFPAMCATTQLPDGALRNRVELPN